MPKSMLRSQITNNVWYKSMLVGNEPFSLGAYELIESNILTASASSVTFSSIPQDYKHLQLRAVMRGTDSTSVLQFQLTLNGASSGFRTHAFFNSGSSVASSNTTGAFIRLDRISGNTADSGDYSPLILDVLDYSNTSKNTTTRAFHGNTSGVSFANVYQTAGLFVNTNAITSITLTPNALNILTGSRFSLYGIKGS